MISEISLHILDRYINQAKILGKQTHLLLLACLDYVVFPHPSKAPHSSREWQGGSPDLHIG